MNKELRSIVGQKKVVAVVPAYNEEKHIEGVVRETKKYVDEVVVVDDASKDKTSELAQKAGATVLRHVINLGLGGTLKTGGDGALLIDADIIITLDGDGQHDPTEIPKLLKSLKYNNADAVFGERPFSKNMPFVKKIGNHFFHLFSKYIFGIKVKDTQTGYRVFTANAYKKIRWNSRDYAVASEMLINAEREQLKYVPQEVRTIYHENQKGTTVLDGLKIARRMLGLKFNK